jgi:capsular polysaccharide biosynthesis protein
MNKETWRKKIGTVVVLLVFIFLFNLSKSRVYESKTDILILPTNETTIRNLDLVVANFQQILMSLAFNDRIAENNDALDPGIELPNYKRKEFWNSKIAITRPEKSGVIQIKSFDQDSALAKELNNDTVENLIAIAGNYYNIKTDLEIRIIDGPIVKQVVSQNILFIIGQSILWTIGIYVIFFLLFPLVFIKKEVAKKEIFGEDFLARTASLKKTVPTILPEEENYFATRNFFKQAKKAATPANLPISEEDVPDIFLQKNITSEIKIEEPVKEDYVSREATEEEVKARLNRLLGAGK